MPESEVQWATAEEYSELWNTLGGFPIEPDKTDFNYWVQTDYGDDEVAGW